MKSKEMADQFVMGFSIGQTKISGPCSRVGFKGMLENMLNGAYSLPLSSVPIWMNSTRHA